jgi:hypothetical protein
MSCGCTSRRLHASHAGLVRSNAAMCVACEHTDRTCGEDWQKGAVLCVDGKPASDKVRDSSCPMGRHMDPKTRRILWMGVWWRGVPLPVRLWAWALHPKHPMPRTFEGCGCMHRLKAFWTRMTPWLRAFVIDLIAFAVIISLLGALFHACY